MLNFVSITGETSDSDQVYQDAQCQGFIAEVPYPGNILVTEHGLNIVGLFLGVGDFKVVFGSLQWLSAV